MVLKALIFVTGALNPAQNEKAVGYYTNGFLNEPKYTVTSFSHCD